MLPDASRDPAVVGFWISTYPGPSATIVLGVGIPGVPSVIDAPTIGGAYPGTWGSSASWVSPAKSQ